MLSCGFTASLEPWVPVPGEFVFIELAAPSSEAGIAQFLAGDRQFDTAVHEAEVSPVFRGADTFHVVRFGYQGAHIETSQVIWIFTEATAWRWKDLAKSLGSDASSIDLTELVAAERFGIRDTWLSNKSDANLTPGLNRKGYHGVAEGRCIHGHGEEEEILTTTKNVRRAGFSG